MVVLKHESIRPFEPLEKVLCMSKFVGNTVKEDIAFFLSCCICSRNENNIKIYIY